MFQRMTDMYGDCPYSQAGQGYISGITSPQYDRQQDIYTSFLHELQDAAALLDSTKPNTVGPPISYMEAIPAAWKKFALFRNGARRHATQQSCDPATAAQWVAGGRCQGGVMNTNADNAILQHQNVTGTPVTNGTGLIMIANDPNAYRLSETFVYFLRNTGDPRLPYLATVPLPRPAHR